MLYEKEHTRDNGKNYYNIPLLYPIYAGTQNSTGSSIGLIFRKHTFDLLDEYGWENGFILYASNQWQQDTHAIGKALSDKYIFNRITNQSFGAFEIKQYHDRSAQKDRFKTISIVYKGVTHILEDINDINQLSFSTIEEELSNMKMTHQALQKRRRESDFKSIQCDY